MSDWIEHDMWPNPDDHNHAGPYWMQLPMTDPGGEWEFVASAEVTDYHEGVFDGWMSSEHNGC